MKRLYAPWRDGYTKTQNNSTPSCPFCVQLQDNNNEKNFILKRFEHTYILLNLYPYNAGHILVLPLEHEADLSKLSKETRIELMEISNASLAVLKNILNPEGFNIGFNIGKFAGGSVPTHLHQHIIPRWSGDTGFLSAICDTRAISVDLKKIYLQLLPAFTAMTL
ncbi:MAG TPA: HIT domain-containing protein [Candidatus Babeliales bacterium]|nr:HIT domain-containing protein [Candidatus Babeliales bacterium]